MAPAPTRFRFGMIHSIDDIASIVVFVAAMISTALSGPEAFTLPQGAVFVGAGILLLALAIYGLPFCQARNWRWGVAPYFMIQVPLSILVLDLSGARAWLVLLPLISQATMVSRRWLLSVTAAEGAGFVIVMAALTSWDNSLQASILFFPAVIFVIIFSEITLREQRARSQVERLATALNAANAKLREYAAQVEELATTKERNRLAREIHDGLGHYLTAINMQIEAARAVIDTDRAHTLDALGKAQALTKEGLTEVRRSVAALRASPIENRPLREALGKMVAECRASGIVAELIVTGTPRPLTPQIELALYRVVEESLTNVRKHAHAARVDLGIDYRASDCVRLTVHDNGVGADDPSGGFGLLGIRERVQLLGGTVRIDTATGQGFAIQVEVPA